MIKFLILFIFLFFTMAVPYTAVNGYYSNIDQAEKAESEAKSSGEEMFQQSSIVKIMVPSELETFDFQVDPLLTPQSHPLVEIRPPSV